MKRNDKGVPVYESEHEHGTMVVVNRDMEHINQVDEVCACVVEGIQLSGPLAPGQYISIIPMPLEVH